MKKYFSSIARTALMCLMLSGFTACTQPSATSEVAAAYQSSGVIAVQPYTRTIFSTHNF